MALRDVIYDGDCGICEAIRGQFERLDWFGFFRWRPNHDESIYREHPQVAPEAAQRAILLVDGGRVLEGFDAFRFIALRLPLLAPLGLLMFLPGVPPIGRIAYRWVADHRKTTLACRLGEPTIFHRWFASAFIVLILGVCAAGMALRTEDWPLTCAPMFATPVEDGGARYSIRFYGVNEDGKRREVASRAGGLPELRMKRVLFGRYYGSVNPRDPHGKHPDDTPEKFEARMAKFCEEFTGECSRKELPERYFHVVVCREANGGLEQHVVGIWDSEKRTFRRRP